MQDLPEGWGAAELGEVADVQLGKMLDREKRKRGKLLPYLRNANVRWGGFALDDLLEMPFEEHELEKFSLRVDDLIVCEGGEPGRAAIWKIPDAEIKFQKALLRIRPRGGIDPRWVLFALKKSALSGELESYFTGSTIKHFPREAVLRFSLPLPPLAEQKRIVEKVEALLAQVQAASDRLERVQQILKRFRQAVLAAAFHGRLTADWREANECLVTGHELLDDLCRSHEHFPSKRRANAAEPSDEAHDLDSEDLPPSWAVAEMERLCEPGRPITYGILKPGPDTPGGVPYVRVADYPGNRLRLEGIRRTTKAIAAEYRRAELRTGDVLLAIRGTFGRVCRVAEELDSGNITQDTARLTIDERVSSDYVLLYLQSPAVQKRLKQAAKGAAVRGVNIGDVRALQVALPRRAEQEEIVLRIRQLFSVIDVIESRAARSLSRASATPRAVLARAFAGELVPTEAELARVESRGYESGEELLARVRAASSSSVPHTSGRISRRKVRQRP